jgi:hydrogenase maturation factor
LVVHSGYAIDRVDGTEAEAVAAELHRGLAGASLEI